jgi:hypothetical protein
MVAVNLVIVAYVVMAWNEPPDEPARDAKQD